MGRANENASDMTSSNGDSMKPTGTREDYENVVQAQVLNEADQLSDDGGERDDSDYTSDVDSDASSLNYTTVVFHK